MLWQKKKNTSWSSWFFKKRRMRAFIFFSKMTVNHSVQNDWQLFICSYPTSKLCQNIHSMYFVYAFSLQQMPINTIMPDLKVSKIHQRGTKPTWYAQSSPITLYLLSKNQSHPKRAVWEYIGWVSDQFHNAHWLSAHGTTRRLQSSHIANASELK